MKFSGIPGLINEKNKLKKLLQSGRTPHAMIFSGMEGTGKLAMALAVIAKVLCEDDTTDEACGHCVACQKTFKMIHPDVHFYFPNSGGKDYTSEVNIGLWREAVLQNVYLTSNHWQSVIEQDNKLLNISADECRGMVKKLSLTIFEGKKRVLMVWLPEYLGHEGNILLKLIEEPPADSVIVLVTDNPAWILPTIRSRCQQISFPPFTNEDIASELHKAGIMDQKKINNIVSTADGNMYDALKMIEDQTNPEVEKMLIWLRLCFRKNVPELKTWCEEIAKEGRDSHRQFLRFGLSLIDYVLNYKISGQETFAFNPEDWKGIKGLAKQLSFEDLETLANLINDHIIFIERNANAKILFNALSINIAQLFAKEEVTVYEYI